MLIPERVNLCKTLLTSLQQAEALYAAALSSAADRDQRHVAASTQQARHKVFGELQQFLSQFPPPFNRTVFDCIPADLLVFFELFWLPNHVGSQTSTGRKLAAPSSVETALYHLSACFQQLQRGVTWNPLSNTGNPARCNELRSWLRGYVNEAADDNFVSTGAQEIDDPKMERLLDHLYKQQLEDSPVHRHLAARDAFAFSLCWETGARGITSGRVSCDHFFLPDGSPALPHIWPTLQLAPGDRVLVVPRKMKTVRGRNTTSITLHVQAGQAPITCPIFWLRQCLDTATECGSPIAPGDAIVRKLARGNQVFVSFNDDRDVTSALGKRFKQHLMLLECYNGESMHSFRRGRAIADTKAGHTDAATMAKMGLKTHSVFQKNYQAPGRHASGVERIRQ